MRSKANQVSALKDQKSEISSQWSRIRLWLALCTMLLPLDSTAEAQQPKTLSYRRAHSGERMV